MTARRSASKRNRTYSADRPVFETLEERRLLTTMYGGQTLAFKDARDNLFMISLGGNIEAEFLGAAVNPNNNFIRPNNLVPASVPEDVPGVDLFAIYVTRATPQSYITIVQIGDDGTPTPFGGPANLNVFPAQGGDLISISGAGASGSLYLGARTIDIDNTDVDLEEDRPILALGLPPGGWGVIPPQPGNFIRAGLSVNNGASLGRFIFDGTITGWVNITGSIGDFYAGNLFTGDARGTGVGARAPMFTDNFNVGGDIRNILIKGFVGTDESATSDEPLYWTGADIQVRGTLGQFRAASHIGASVDVRNALTGPFLNTPQREMEYVPLGNEVPLSFGELGGDEFFTNDTFDTAQYLPAVIDPIFGGAAGVRVTGLITFIDDPSDYYGLALLAGQTIWVTSTSPLGETFAPLVGVYDPDGRLVASNYNDILPFDTIGKPFQFTADRPGVYRFAVGDLTTVTGGEGQVISSPSYGVYSLRVQFTGHVALGGIVSDAGNVLDLLQVSGIKVWRGDFGALSVGDMLISNSNSTIDVPFGNLRSVRGPNLGEEGGTSTQGISVHVPFGHVGLLQSTVGTLVLGTPLDAAFVPIPIGGDFQIIDAASTLSGSIPARKAIGIIRAADVSGATNINVNADDTGRDGVISLIDVTGGWGSETTGGPRISTNLGGNVGHVRIGGEIYRDSRFGAGPGRIGNTITVPAGRSLTVTDDSGTLINIAPRLIPNPRYIPGFTNPANPADPRTQPYLGKPADFTVTTLPIFGSGGAAIVEVITDRSLVLSSHNPSRDDRHAEIGRVVFTEGGAPVIMETVFQPGTGPGTGLPGVPVDTRPALDPSATLDVSLYVQGPTPISILDTAFGDTGSLAANLIQNTSGGDMPIIRAGSIGNLYGSSVGTARLTAAKTALLPRESLLNTYPFIDERIGVVVGDVVNIGATEAIGNVSASGVIGAIFPNSDNFDVTDVFEGIVGSISAAELRYVDIGEGIAAGGTGYDNQAGVFSTGQIRIITNRGRGDIRGPVVSVTKINRITLTDGSIINANIGVTSELDHISDFRGLISLPSGNDPIDNPGYELGPITLQGNGGIIGSAFYAADIDTVHVQQGFGIMSSVFMTTGTGRINRIIADGYGLRNILVSGGGSVTELNATGNGAQVDSSRFGYATRLSEFGYRIDPFFGFAPNRLTDLHANLGTTKGNRMIDNVTNSGIIEDALVEASIDLNGVYGNRIRRSTFNVADRIDVFQTRGPIRDIEINTGRLRKMLIAGDVADSLINVAGPIEDFYVTGSINERTNVQAIGASGRIDRFQVLGFLGGDIRTTGILNTLAVGRDILATSRIEADDIPTRYIGGQIFGQIVIT